jgi:uncharacterized membrane protein
MRCTVDRFVLIGLCCVVILCSLRDVIAMWYQAVYNTIQDVVISDNLYATNSVIAAPVSFFSLAVVVGSKSERASEWR